MNRSRGSRAISQWIINSRDSVIADVILLESLGLMRCRNCADAMLGCVRLKFAIGTPGSTTQCPVATERDETNIQFSLGSEFDRVVIPTYCCLPPRFPQKAPPSCTPWHSSLMLQASDVVGQHNGSAESDIVPPLPERIYSLSSI